jgi:catechol 2,3-dioxygenase
MWRGITRSPVRRAKPISAETSDSSAANSTASGPPSSVAGISRPESSGVSRAKSNGVRVSMLPTVRSGGRHRSGGFCPAMQPQRGGSIRRPRVLDGGMSEQLAADTAMGPVTLAVADLDGMTAYYRDAVTLEVLDGLDPRGDRVTLGRGTTPVVILEHAPELRHASPSEAGLFHTAILYDTEAALAAAVYSVASRHPNTFTGSSDHLVSKAFYFTDPEGNGVELYWDRDRSDWSWVHGTVEMGTLYLDPNAFLQQHLTQEAVDQPRIGGARVGHVHLQVGDVAGATEFYVDKLGFAKTAAFGDQAVFVSAGGYHHHMAMNTWNSRGAGPRLPALGLARIDIAVPTTDDVGALTERLTHHGIQVRDDGQTVAFDDPWSNLILVTAER